MNTTNKTSTLQNIHELDKKIIFLCFTTLFYISVLYIIGNAIFIIFHRKEWSIVAINIFILVFISLFISMDEQKFKTEYCSK